MNCRKCHDTGVVPASASQPEEVCGCVDEWVNDKLEHGIWLDLRAEGEFGPALQDAFREKLPDGARYDIYGDFIKLRGFALIIPELQTSLRELIRASVGMAQTISRQPQQQAA